MKPDKKACTPIKIMPLSMSAQMAGQTAAGRKSVTRRPMAWPEDYAGGAGMKFLKVVDGEALFDWGGGPGNVYRKKCPYPVGQIYYVREPWYTMIGCNHLKPSELPVDCSIQYLAESNGFKPSKYRQGRFMPRIFARTFIRILAVRCERLNCISEADALAEGIVDIGDIRVGSGDSDVVPNNYSVLGINDPNIYNSAQLAFRSLWESIYGVGSWDLNPWVWVIEFERLQMENPWNPVPEWEPLWVRENGAWCAKYFAYWFGGVSCLLTVEDVNFCHAWTWQIGDDVPISGQADSANQAMKDCFASLCAGLLRRKEAGK